MYVYIVKQSRLFCDFHIMRGAQAYMIAMKTITAIFLHLFFTLRSR